MSKTMDVLVDIQDASDAIKVAMMVANRDGDNRVLSQLLLSQKALRRVTEFMQGLDNICAVCERSR